MNRKRRAYSPEFRTQIIAEYYSSDLNLNELSKKYGIQGSTTVSNWIKKHEEREGLSSTNTCTLDAIMSSYKEKSKEELLAYIKELEKSLELSQDKSIALEHFIRNSEKELGVSLPKKPFTNRSKS